MTTRGEATPDELEIHCVARALDPLEAADRQTARAASRPASPRPRAREGGPIRRDDRECGPTDSCCACVASGAARCRILQSGGP
jgi:hypothetical protein